MYISQQPNSNLKIVALIAALLLLMCIIGTSCNPYKKLAKRPPLTAADSAALAKQCVKAFPADTTAKSDTVYVLPIDSSEYYRLLAERLFRENKRKTAEIVVKYKDTCTTAQQTYEEGFNIGYDVGFAQCKANPVHDTLLINTHYWIQDNAVLKMLEGDLATARQEISKLQKKSSWKGTALIASIAFLLLLLFVIYKLATKKKAP